jgi:hypothetical protein
VGLKGMVHYLRAGGPKGMVQYLRAGGGPEGDGTVPEGWWA